MTNAGYWCNHRLRIAVEGPSGRDDRLLERPFARIGSHPGADIRLPAGEVPARCFYLHASRLGVFALQLANPSSTESPLCRWLSAGERLVVGPYQITAEIEDGQTSAASGPSQQPNPVGKLRYPELLASVNDQILGRVPISGPFTVLGRRRPSSVRLANPSVSACHCVLYADGSQLWAIDLLSSNGTYLNGNRVESAQLCPGDCLQLGPVELRCNGSSLEAGSVAAELEPAAMPMKESKPSERTHETDLAAVLAAEREQLAEQGRARDAEVRRLEEERQQFSRERQRWEEARQEAERLLATEREQLAEQGRTRDAEVRRLEEERQQFGRERQQWEEARQEAERLLATEREQLAEQGRTRNAEVRRLEEERQQFGRERQQWEEARQETERILATEREAFATLQADYRRQREASTASEPEAGVEPHEKIASHAAPEKEWAAAESPAVSCPATAGEASSEGAFLAAASDSGPIFGASQACVDQDQQAVNALAALVDFRRSQTWPYRLLGVVQTLLRRSSGTSPD